MIPLVSNPATFATLRTYHEWHDTQISIPIKLPKYFFRDDLIRHLSRSNQQGFVALYRNLKAILFFRQYYTTDYVLFSCAAPILSY